LEYQTFDDATLERIWAAYDVDESGSIDVLELAALLGDLMAHRQEQGVVAAGTQRRGQDMGGVGGVGILGDKGGGIHLPPEVVRAYFDEMDADHSGDIDKAEFIAFAQRAGFQDLL
jgi:Ca2+-binding EF-hand superfamily protein